jgi:hypothetical protein
LHFLVRFAGLTGLVVAGVGLSLALLDGLITWEIIETTWNQLQALAQGRAETYPPLAVSLLLGGIVAGLFTLLVEVLVVLRLVAGRRSAFGFNAAVQVALAAALLVGVNWFSFQHYLRLDWTRDRVFTLPTEPINLPAELAKLKEPTTIVVYTRHKTFGHLSDKPDAYDYAAERKVVEKVRDLVDLFREFGPQFKVEVLDVEAEGYGSKFNQLTQALAEEAVRSQDSGTGDRSEAVQRKTRQLRKLMRTVPENTIFFFAGDRMERMSFNEFYQLDKVASKLTGLRQTQRGEEDEEDEDRSGSNLVLLSQGVGPFARKLLNIDQRRPRVGVLVVHEFLTTQGPELYGLKGLKKSLEAHGMDVRDVILRKWNEFSEEEPEPAAYTYEENRFEINEQKAKLLESDIEQLEKVCEQLRKAKKTWETDSLKELSQKVGVPLTEEDRKVNVAFVGDRLAQREAQLELTRKERATAKSENAGLSKLESLREQRRLGDVKAKLDRQLADCDLIIIPRLTHMILTAGWGIGNELHHLDKAQTEAIRDYLKAGKPILACFGPINDLRGDGGAPKNDEIEEMLSQLGIRFGKTVVVFDTERKSLTEQRSGLQSAGLDSEAPSIAFDWESGTLRQLDPAATLTGPRPPNRLRQSMAIAQRSVGKDLVLPPRHPRPVAFDPTRGKPWLRHQSELELRAAVASLGGALPVMPYLYVHPDSVKGEPAYSAEVMITSPDSENEDRPSQLRQRTRRPDEDVKMEATRPRGFDFDAKRRGPFPIAVAVEATAPEEWYAGSGAVPKTVRVVAIGDGAFFLAKELSPAKERLLLNTCNWLLGRDDQLPRDEQEWRFPRLELDRRAQTLWTAAAWLGPPLLFAYLGIVVLMVRRLR